jgi:DNA-binding FadR family transcriptional regulator
MPPMTPPATGTATTASQGDARRAVDERLFTPIRTRNTVEDITGQILDRIRAGELQEGDRLPGERALAATMEVSRPTLRLAIASLAKAGVVDVTPGRAGGMRIASHWIPHDLLERSPLDADEIFEALEARRMLEPRVAQLAAMRAGDEDFEAMQRTIADQHALVKEGSVSRGGREDRFLALDVRFHLALARSTGNGVLVGLVRSVYRDLEIARDMAMHRETVPDWSIDIHERTLAAIRSGDLDQVDVVMDEHLAQLERTWEQESARALVRPLPSFLVPSGGKVP